MSTLNTETGIYPKGHYNIWNRHLMRAAWPSGDLQILPKPPEPSSSQIPQIVFIFIRLPLKANHIISFIGTSVLQQPDEVFQKIPDKERQHQQFQLLPEVNSLVIHEHRIILKLPPLHKNEGPEDDPVKAPGQHIFIYYHEHAYKIRNAKFVIWAF